MNVSLSEILLSLKEQNEVTTQQISNYTNIPKGTLDKLFNGQTEDPRADTLKKLANYFNVSIDYLLGLSESKSIDELDKEIVEILGLNDESIKTLRGLRNATQGIFSNDTIKRDDKFAFYNYKKQLKIINILLCGKNSRLIELISDFIMVDFISAEKEIGVMDDKTKKLLSTRFRVKDKLTNEIIIFDVESITNIYLFEIQKVLTNLREEHQNEHLSNQKKDEHNN